MTEFRKEGIYHSVCCIEIKAGNCEYYKNFHPLTNVENVGCWRSPVKKRVLTFNICELHLQLNRLWEILNINIHFWIMVLFKKQYIIPEILNHVFVYLMPYGTIYNRVHFMHSDTMLFPVYHKIPFKKSRFINWLKNINGESFQNSSKTYEILEHQMKTYMWDVLEKKNVIFKESYFRLLHVRNNKIVNIDIRYRDFYRLIILYEIIDNELRFLLKQIYP